jgi:hypothetical protein
LIIAEPRSKRGDPKKDLSRSAAFELPVIEMSRSMTILASSIATELLATDVLGVVMAPTMWARQEKSSAGFHFMQHAKPTELARRVIRVPPPAT